MYLLMEIGSIESCRGSRILMISSEKGKCINLASELNKNRYAYNYDYSVFLLPEPEKLHNRIMGSYLGEEYKPPNLNGEDYEYDDKEEVSGEELFGVYGEIK